MNLYQRLTDQPKDIQWTGVTVHRHCTSKFLVETVSTIICSTVDLNNINSLAT